MKDHKSHAYDSHGVSATELRERLEESVNREKALLADLADLVSKYGSDLIKRLEGK